MTKREALQSLHSVLHLLPANKRDFANSLLDQAVARGDLSQNQWHWVLKLTEMADHAPTAPAWEAQAAQFLPIVELLRAAANGRARLPNFRVLVGKQEVRLKLAGEQSRQPGSVNITLVGVLNGNGREAWAGRITADGRLDLNGQLDTQALVAALTAFVADPAAAAKAFADATSACCFCTTPLSDPRSVFAGYGPICAEKWALPWGELACEAVEAESETAEGIRNERRAHGRAA